MIRRPPKSTQSRSSAASDVYKRQDHAYLEPTLGALDLRADKNDQGHQRAADNEDDKAGAPDLLGAQSRGGEHDGERGQEQCRVTPVSYTHLTLPTIYSV